MQVRRSPRLPIPLLLLFGSMLLAGCDRFAEPTAQVVAAPLPPDEPVRGWMILSDSEPDGLAVIAAAPAYGINQLQLSHDVVHDLRHVREERRRHLAETLTRAAHSAGIQEVVLWDRSLYPLDYYPERFKTGPRGTLDLDDPAFWEWFKQDYREMLDLVPEIQGLVLTFIETGARVEDQHSERMTSPQEKLAAVELARRSVGHVEEARPHLSTADHDDLFHYFTRSLLTTELHRAAASAYFGFRVYSRGGVHQSDYVHAITRDGLLEMRRLAEAIRGYPVKPAAGQWNWVSDADTADRYFTWITEGWPPQTRGIPNPHGGQRLPVATLTGR